ncbi:MAG TPA: polyprenyl synthetase family protein [Flavobacteriaceae bacterium]|nr:polyprenyl synthetase family protein [Flavobacteriaceae bacterium]MCB9212207.1 polyprenyl synthetase family protein [Alteromonas sp.]HPF10415.1 polyprenyl synthetase family protein [Flavobacteriaceae bacterium]HQU20479.1 polyprenyl synthetase family protein [Flavobacteriaceae bacterium]HQU64626.1 polyprenyl synthetase family protein [Flavobacteriaceae bacterium]
MLDLTKYKNALALRLKEEVTTKEPRTLYEPIDYILSLGGKQLRPVLTLMSCDLFGQDYLKAMNAALAVEWFHNFSLIHDDIMDEAPLRRGAPTVHEKWNLNTGILSGDAMLILAYRFFEGYEPPLFQELAQLFSKTALEVCEGQQYDVDFESRNEVTVSEYLKMITYKTAVLLGAAVKMGAIVAGASEVSKQSIYEFGKNLGIAFQLQDDYLDAFGDPKKFGKQVGGDILANKKTYLYLHALEHAAENDRNTLLIWFGTKTDAPEKVAEVKAIFERSGTTEATRNMIEQYTQKAFEVLEQVQILEDQKNRLREFGGALMNREL